MERWIAIILRHTQFFQIILLVGLLVGDTAFGANSPPAGVFEGQSTRGYFTGWAYDPSAPTKSIEVHFYIVAGSKYVYAGKTTTSASSYRFNFKIPDAYRMNNFAFVAYGIDAEGLSTNNVRLYGGPWMTFGTQSHSAVWASRPRAPTTQEKGNWNNYYYAWDATFRWQASAIQSGGYKTAILGDSITAFWTYSDPNYGGLLYFNQLYGPLSTLQLGLAGDKTSEMLWRLENFSTGFRPKLIVVMAGTNNLGAGQSVDQTRDGVKTIAEAICVRFPGTRVLILSILPRGFGDSSGNSLRTKIRSVNQKLAALANVKDIFYLDIYNAFIDKNGLPITNYFDARDGVNVHLTSTGYKQYMYAIQNYVNQLSK